MTDHPPCPRVLDAVLGQPWAIKPEWLNTIAAIAQRGGDETWAQNHPPRQRSIHAHPGKPLGNSLDSTARGATAIIPILGPIFPRANMLTEMSGAASLEHILRDVEYAVADPDITSIILDIDSPGGVAFGVSEGAGLIRQAAAQKPVVAYVGGMGCSAAYWLATAAGEIVAEKTAMLGSIGVVTGANVQEGLDRDGYRQFEIVSSNAPNKRPDLATDEGVAVIRAELDALEATFIDAVAAYRNVTRDTVLNTFAQGGVLVGDAAVAAGMADRLGTFESVLAGLSGTTSAPIASGGRPITQDKELSIMSVKPDAPAADTQPEITVDYIAKNHPTVADQIRAETIAAEVEASVTLVETARAEAATAERERILGIQAHAAGFPGHGDLVAKLVADGETTPDAAAGQILAAEQGTGARKLAENKAAEGALPTIEANVDAQPNAGGVDAGAPIEDRAKAIWDADPAIRGEFQNEFGRYLAFAKAEDSGKVRVLRKSA